MNIEILASDSVVDVAFKVCTYLAENGQSSVLTGGSCATLYAPEAYQSSDVDLIASFATNRPRVEEMMRGLGFLRQGRIYVHPSTIVTLDFPDDQVLIGDEFITEFNTVRRGELALRALTPTDCVRDRLLWFFTEDDRSALGTAVGVAKQNAIDLDGIERWSASQGYLKQFETFRARLA